MKGRFEKIILKVCIGVLILLSMSILIRAFVRTVFIKGLGISNDFTSLIFFDAQIINSQNENNVVHDQTWGADEYPFGEAISDEKDFGICNKYLQIVDNVKWNIDNYTSSLLVGYDKAVDCSNWLEYYSGWNISSSETSGETYIGDNQWVELCEKRDVSLYVDSLCDFSEFCKEQDIPFLYVQAPGKISEFQDTELSGLVDFSNQNMNELLSELRKNGIDTFDLRQQVEVENINNRNLFFRTDHHWKPEAALWASKEISCFLNQNYDFEIDETLFDKEQYQEKTYPSYFAGSTSKKNRALGYDADDFPILLPSFDHELELIIPSIGYNQVGDLSITYDWTMLDGNEDNYGNNSFAYTSYFWGSENSLKIVHNYRAQDNHKILIIGDSFCRPLCTFMELGVAELDYIDPRVFNGSIQNYIRQTNPDMIIFIHYPGPVQSEIDWKSHTDFWDLR